MEHPVGRPFKINGIAYVAVVDKVGTRDCHSCAVSNYCRVSGSRMPEFGECVGCLRSDGLDVHFEHFGVDF